MSDSPWKLVDLTESFKVIGGGVFLRETAENGVPILRGRDLAHADLSREDVEQFVEPKKIHQERFAKEGDILLQRIGERPRTLLVTDQLDGCYVGDTLFILRPMNERVDSAAAAQYLRSSIGQEALRAAGRGAVVPTLSKMSFSSIRIPVLPAEYGKELEAAKQAEERIRRFVEQLAEKRGDVFEAATVVDAERRITDVSSTRRIVETTLGFVEDLNYRLRNFYPLPLAFPFRQADTEHDPLRSLKELYRNAEGISAFLAALGLVVIPMADNRLKKKLKQVWGGKGATFGNWVSLLREISVGLDVNGASLGRAIKALMDPAIDSDFTRDVSTLVDARDEFHHDKLPSEGAEVEASLKLARQCAIGLLEEVGFLLRHPLRLVLDFDAIRGSDQIDVTCLDYAGDHPSCRKVIERHDRPLKKRDLYILIEGKEWTPLYPFISMQPTQGTARETFYVDAWNATSGVAQLKSFETGYTVESPEIGLEIESWLSTDVSIATEPSDDDPSSDKPKVGG